MCIRDRPHLDVDAIDQRPREAGEVASALVGRALARALWRGRLGARAGVRGQDQHESGGKRHRARGPRHGDLSGLQRLAERVENAGREFGRLVEEQDPSVGEGDGSWPDHAAAPAHDGGDRRRVMWRHERRVPQQRAPRRQDSRDRMDGGDLQRLVAAERREQGGQPLGEHGLAGAGLPHHPEVVTARGAHFEGTACHGLPGDVRQVG